MKKVSSSGADLSKSELERQSRCPSYSKIKSTDLIAQGFSNYYLPLQSPVFGQWLYGRQ
jgi:hypothetical protein